jgi:hypothetical protein
MIAAGRGNAWIRHALFCLGGLALSLGLAPLAAQQPDTLRLTLHNPGTTPQLGARQGLSVGIDGDWVVVGSPYDDLGGTDAGTVKVYNAITGALTHVLANPNLASNDAFGYSVAISGTRVVVGAPFDDTGASDAGSAYVYDLAGATPTIPVATFNNPTPGSDDLFGRSVAASGHLVVVGAPHDDTGAGDAGSVYVYDFTNTVPDSPAMTLGNPSPVANDRFGYSVAASGSRIVIGTPYNDSGADGAGRVYVYDVTRALPTTPLATLNNPYPAIGDNFGTSVAVSGMRVVVGAPYDYYAGFSGTGLAFVYNVPATGPRTLEATLNIPDPSNSDLFGWSVAVSGPLVVVGALQGDEGTTDAGSAHVFDMSGPSPATPTLALTIPGPNVNDQFGGAVAVRGLRVVVGAPLDDTQASDAGSAYVYDLGGASPSLSTVTLNTPSPTVGDEFGTAVAVSGTHVVVGAPRDDTGAIDAGSAYVFDLAGIDPAVPVATLRNPSPAAGDLFGVSVGISGTKVVVGAPGDDTGATDAGSAYLYDLAGATPTTPVATLNNPTPAGGDNFGRSVAIDGTWVVAGAPYDDGGAGNAGSAYVYYALGASTALLATIPNPSPALNDYFGWAVAVSGTRTVVGAPRDSTGASTAGSAYVYNLSGGAATIPVATLNSTTPFERFGSAVAASGDRVLVGAPNNTGGAAGSGRARVYHLTSATPTVPVATLNKPTPVPYDSFGSFVAISGTRAAVGALNGDGFASAGENAFVFDLAGTVPATPVVTLTNSSPNENDFFAWSGALDGTTLVIGAPLAEGASVDRGVAFVFGPNRSPTGLLLANNTIAEHHATGTTVGFFVPEDPDDGDAHVCILVSGVGATDNANFTIANGTNLLATTSFDYETRNSYSIRVRATDRAGLFVEQSFTVLVSDIEEQPPTILAGPVSVTNVVGGTVTFSVSAAGTAPLTYQWRMDGGDLGGATGVTFGRTGLTRQHSGRYSVVVSNAFGHAVSADAMLVVGGAPQRLLAPVPLGAGRFRIPFSDADGGALSPWDLGILQAQGTSSLPGGWVNLTNEIIIDNGVGYVEFVVTNDPPHRLHRIRMQ